MLKRVLLLLCSLHLPSTWAATYTLCYPDKKIVFDPSEKMSNGKTVAIWHLLFMPIISSNARELGVLSNYEFSPDGKTLHGRINKNIKWNDGSSVTSCEFIQSLNRAFKGRPFGEKIQLKKRPTEYLSCKPSHKTDPTFEVTLEGGLENMTAIIKEALSSGAKLNRVWMYKQAKGSFSIVSKHPFLFREKKLEIIVNKTPILVSEEHCNSPDLTLYPEFLKIPLTNYVAVASPTKQIIFADFNTNTTNIKERKTLTELIWNAFSEADPKYGIDVKKTFFSKMPPKLEEKHLWSTQVKPMNDNLFKNILIHYTIPAHKKIIAQYFSKNGIPVKFTDQVTRENEITLRLNTASFKAGNIDIFQDTLSWPMTKNFLKNAKKTHSLLKKISSSSAFSSPLQKHLIETFSDVAKTEWAIVPIARRSAYAYTRKNIPITMTWNNSGEITLKTKK